MLRAGQFLLGAEERLNSLVGRDGVVSWESVAHAEDEPDIERSHFRLVVLFSERWSWLSSPSVCSTSGRSRASRNPCASSRPSLRPYFWHSAHTHSTASPGLITSARAVAQRGWLEDASLSSQIQASASRLKRTAELPPPRRATQPSIPGNPDQPPDRIARGCARASGCPLPPPETDEQCHCPDGASRRDSKDELRSVGTCGWRRRRVTLDPAHQSSQGLDLAALQ
jgi:hypothetical protein